MPGPTVSPLEAHPYFDLELLLSVSQETRIGQDMMEQLSTAWDRWLPHVRACRIDTGDAAYLAVWLEEAVEEAVDDMWETVPSDAFMFNSLAQVMCMGTVHALIPEVEDVGCAPAPQADPALSGALEVQGLGSVTPEGPALVRRFAVVTYLPFRGGCEICALKARCPKAGGGDGFSMVLPGHEELRPKE